MKPLRPRSLGTKLTEVEYARVEAAALKAGVGLSEWCRRAVLEFAERDSSQPAEKVVLAEVLSLRSVLLSLVFQMSKGQAVSEEEMRRLIDRADREKHKKATALLGECATDARTAVKEVRCGMAGKQSWAEKRWWRGTAFDLSGALLCIVLVFVLGFVASLRCSSATGRQLLSQSST